MRSTGRSSDRRGIPMIDRLAEAVLAGDRAALARAITLVESRRSEHEAEAQALLSALLPSTGGADRIGISGVPGVGKSTFIESLGLRLTAAGRRVAVLAVDPSSGVSGGSILGDKTRMERLANDASAFVRPSPSGGTLGGVARRTREAMLLCEAAGYDVVVVETVGVGQSETEVADMVDVFLLLMLAGAGDELQGIKRGVLEIADIVAMNKADGDNVERAAAAAAGLRSALRLLSSGGGEPPPVLTCSALTGDGLDQIWAEVERLGGESAASGARAARRRDQSVRWLWRALDDMLVTALHADPAVADRMRLLEADVRANRVPATVAAAELLHLFRNQPNRPYPSDWSDDK